MASRNGIGVVLLGLGVVACLAGAMYWWVGHDQRWFYTDDGARSSTLDGASPRDVMWRPPDSLPAAINSAIDEADPGLSVPALAEFLNSPPRSRRTGRGSISRATGWGRLAASTSGECRLSIAELAPLSPSDHRLTAPATRSPRLFPMATAVR